MGLLADKVAVVTGASRGIGKAIALRFAEEKCFVFCINRDPALGSEIVSQIHAAGGQAASIIADLSDRAACENVIESALRDKGKIDILVNNAGITADNLFIRMKDDEWDRVIDTNLSSVFFLTRPAIRSMMKARYGKVITISSVVAHTGNPGQVNYTSAKAGLVGFSKSLAKEVASRNINCNVISPGFIETDITAKLNAEQKEAIVKNIPFKRVGKVEDISNAALFLASDQSSYITGSVLHVNGGLF